MMTALTGDRVRVAVIVAAVVSVVVIVGAAADGEAVGVRR